MKKDKIISTRVDPETREKLDTLCKALDRPQAWVIAVLLAEADQKRLQEISEGGHL
jgi:predicted transcriptional regulator